MKSPAHPKRSHNHNHNRRNGSMGHGSMNTGNTSFGIPRRASTGYSLTPPTPPRSSDTDGMGMGRKATLQNNIGVMMLHKNSIDEARDRFHAAILASDYNNNDRLHNTTSRGYDTPTKKSITLVHADIPGLTWFHNKLQRECNSTHTATTNNTTTNNTTNNNNSNKSSYPQVASSLSQSSSSLGQQPSSSFEHHHHHRHHHHHHHRTDIPSNVPLTVNAHHPMASWNHNIEKNVPLGLEFVSLPLHVHSTNLNTGSPAESESAADARCAAYLNLARLRLEFPDLHDADDDDERDDAQCRHEDGDGGGLVEEVLALCKASLDPLPKPNDGGDYPAIARPNGPSSPSRRCRSERPMEDSPPETARSRDAEGGECENDERMGVSPSLEVVARNNAGVLLFSLDRFREAVHEFASAYDVVQCSTAADPPPHATPSPRRNHEASPVLPHDYLHLVTLFNLSRTCIRINDLAAAERYIDALSQLPSTLHIPPPVPASPWSVSTAADDAASPTAQHQHQHLQHLLHHRYKYLQSLSRHYHSALLRQREEHLTPALEHYNDVLGLCRRELGHEHIYVATVLEKKGKVLFDQRKLQTAMLSYLAGLRVYEKQQRKSGGDIVEEGGGGGGGGEERRRSDDHDDTPLPPHRPTHTRPSPPPSQKYRQPEDDYRLERSRILYEIGRTLHDREEYFDALRVYQKALELRRGKTNTNTTTTTAEMKEGIKILTNIGRMHHIMGDLDGAVSANVEIADMAVRMVREHAPDDHDKDDEEEDDDDDKALRHAFVRNQFVVLGNLYVEAGRLGEAMHVFSRISRQQRRRRQRQRRRRHSADGGGSEDPSQNHAGPEEEDVDTTSAFAVRAAERLGNLRGNGGQSLTAAAA